jgi:tetratricopeptide (TPR) repeat protein/serine/threonine protein kinase
MPEQQPQVDEVFDEALRRAAGPDRDRYLEEACGGDLELRRRVERLLRAVAEAGSFLEAPAQDPSPTVDQPPGEQSGAVIGPYKRIEPIGEGGMGTVWMAQQTEPVKRLVALKLIKAGMDSKQVIARFEAERQALALMDHPNIAKVLDAGTTSAGRPYFVMDLVKGVPITRYCDEHHLTPRQRLKLFMPVCQAVQHAHQKGIIHRDLKPSNVLVALYDGKPVPKVIDFGVAKAAGQSLTEKTLVTGFGSIVGTFEYMSPEQAEINQLDIDTRSDIYSLGVLLYELLTGSPPFTRKELKKVGVLEMLRVIREHEPSKPSTKLSTAEGLPTLAANRGTEPAKLTRLVRGELDWIVMKALEKDRNRRYETANGFAMDVQRYLADEPVLACPPTVGYRVRKFAWRNKVALAFTGLVLLVLLTATGGIGWNVRDRAARQAIVEGEVLGALEEAENASKGQRFSEALSAVKRGEGLLASGGGSTELHERIRQGRADLDLVVTLQEATTEGIEIDVAKSNYDYAPAIAMYQAAFQKYGIDRESTTTAEAVRQIRSRPPQIQLIILETMDRWWAKEWKPKRSLEEQRKQDWLMAVIRGSDDDSWRGRMRQATDRRDFKILEDLANSDAVMKQGPSTLRTLADWLEAGGKGDLALAILRRAQHAHPGDFLTNNHLGLLLLNADPPQPEDAVRFFAIAVALNPDNAGARLNLGVALRKLGKLEEATAEYRKAIELRPDYAMPYSNLGNALASQKKFDEALVAFREAIRRKPDSGFAHAGMGGVLLEQKKFDEAIAAYREALKHTPDFADAHYWIGIALARQCNIREGSVHVGKEIDARKLDEMIVAFRKATKQKPDYAAAWGMLAYTLLLKSPSDEALAAYREAIRLWPNDDVLHAGLGDVLADQGRKGEALEAYRQAIKLKPDNPAWYEHLGGIHMDLKQWEAAAAAFRKAVELEPGRAIKPAYLEAHYNLGALLCDVKHDYNGAIAAFREVIRLKPDLPNAHFCLGNALRGEGKLDDAVAAYRDAIRLKPDYPMAHLCLGMLLQEHKRDYEGAIATLREAIRFSPADANTRNNLAWLLANCPEPKHRQPAQAVALAQEAVKLAPNAAYVWNTLGVAQYRAGDCNAAVAALQKSIELNNGGYGGDWFVLAMAHHKLGHPKEARQWFDKAVEQMEKAGSQDQELRRFRAEAEGVLEIKKGTEQK